MKKKKKTIFTFSWQSGVNFERTRDAMAFHYLLIYQMFNFYFNNFSILHILSTFFFLPFELINILKNSFLQFQIHCMPFSMNMKYTEICSFLRIIKNSMSEEIQVKLFFIDIFDNTNYNYILNSWIFNVQPTKDLFNLIHIDYY